ncbi:MAG: low specificity L-threonine aldolase [Acidimicrobiia bacterium]|nr:low specificity L-threonine aldolase [Acidimicrobiia bacterium]
MIDLFSDTHTIPDAGMRAAMAAAEVGDEQLGEDPTTKRLLERVTQLLDKEAALFLPTGSMCNKVAVAAFTRPGDALVCDHRAHVLRAEGGGAAALSGVVIEPIVTGRGHFTPEQLEAVLNPGTLYQSRTALVALEQTHNFAGGTVWPLGQYQAVADVAHRHGAAVFTDGARMLNAAAATGTTAAQWAAPVDAIWIDFSKGLGGPGGAAIAGSKDFVARANRFKFLFGGGMRQSGFLAAAALYGLDHNLDRLAMDNALARRLGDGLAALGLEVIAPESNMVFFTPPRGIDPPAMVAAMAKAGVRSWATKTHIRLVTHLGVSAEDVEAALVAIARVVKDR